MGTEKYPFDGEVLSKVEVPGGAIYVVDVHSVHGGGMPVFVPSPTPVAQDIVAVEGSLSDGAVAKIKAYLRNYKGAEK